MNDKLTNISSYQLLNVIGVFNRNALGIEVNFSLPSERLIRT
jgi:putative transposase